MSRGVNRVTLIGHLGADPETRYSAGGSAITTLRLATTESWKDKSTGELQERTEWHRVKLFGRQGEVAGEYLRKGSQVYIDGSLRTDKYTDKDGIERYSTDIIAADMQMLGNGNQRSSNDDQHDGGLQRSQSRPQPAPQQQRDRGSARSQAPSRSNAPNRSPVPAGDFADDDDIPW